MKKLALILAACMVFTLGACGDAKEEITPTEENIPVNDTLPMPDNLIRSLSAVYPEPVPANDYEARQAWLAENAVPEEFVAAINGFAQKTAAELLLQEENVCYSPISLYYALALCATGAGGETQAEMLRLLGVEKAEELSGLCAKLFRYLYTDGESSRLTVANSLWIDDDLAGFIPAFAENAAKNFYAGVNTVDFSDTKKTGKLIGDWISENTGGKLKGGDNVDPQTIAEIINAVYFCDRWMNTFNEAATQKGTFFAKTGEVECDFMHRTFDYISYAVGEGYSRITLRFEQNGSMTFVLPDKGTDISGLLSADVFSGGEEKSGKVQLSLPKFRTESSFDLVKMLRGMGMEKAFTGDADFYGMLYVPACISDVIQKTYIDVQENGVEAAAYTEIMMRATAIFAPEEPYVMTFDRPFLYRIEAQNGTTLFTGVCGDPTK